MSDLLLSRTLDLADYDHLAEELALVDAVGIPGQHEHRRWEYALALHAYSRWTARTPIEVAVERDEGYSIYDVGGGGSPFMEILRRRYFGEIEEQIIDPRLSEEDCQAGLGASKTLAQYVASSFVTGDVVFCLSVIEHVADLDQFLYHLSCLVTPGGLLCLTMDFWNRCGPDTATNRDLRERIFCPKTYLALRNSCTLLHLTTFGGVDPTYHGAHVHDYSFASLVLEKRR